MCAKFAGFSASSALLRLLLIIEGAAMLALVLYIVGMTLPKAAVANRMMLNCILDTWSRNWSFIMFLNALRCRNKFPLTE